MFSIREQVRVKTLLAIFNLVSLGFAVVCFISTYRMERSLTNDDSPPYRVAFIGRDLTQDEASYRDIDAERAAAFARAGGTLSILLLLLGLSMLAGPRRLRIVASNLLVLLFLLLGLEALTQVFGIHFPAVVRRGERDRNLWVYDMTKGWFHNPLGIGATPVSGPDRGDVRINTLGLRGREISKTKPQGVKRVLVFGDSFAFGIGVDEEHLLSSQLETFLNERSPGRYEVVNMGVAGYSTDQELVLLQELGLQLSPDLVVLVMCDNDFVGNTQDFVYRRYYKPYFEIESGGELSRRNVPVPVLSRTQRTKLFLAQESNLWNFVRSRNSEQAAVQRFLDWFQIGVSRPPTADPVELTSRLVVEFAERVHSAGSKVFVINTGHSGETTTLFHALRPSLRRPGIHLLGMEEVLADARRNSPDGLWQFPGDIHWNIDGHRLVADVVWNYISRYGLLETEQ